MGGCQSLESAAGDVAAARHAERVGAREAFATTDADLPAFNATSQSGNNGRRYASKDDAELEQHHLSLERSSSTGSVTSEPGAFRTRIRHAAVLVSAKLNGIDDRATRIDESTTRAFLRSPEVIRGNASVRRWLTAVIDHNHASAATCGSSSTGSPYITAPSTSADGTAWSEHDALPSPAFGFDDPNAVSASLSVTFASADDGTSARHSVDESPTLTSEVLKHHTRLLGRSLLASARCHRLGKRGSRFQRSIHTGTGSSAHA